MATVAPVSADREGDIPLVDLRRPVRRSVIDRPPSWLRMPAHLSVVELRLAAVHLDCDSPASYEQRVRGLVIGENAGKRTHPDLPLFPWPERSSAGRLLEMSGMTGGQYLGGLYRRNLCNDRHWDKPEAEETARLLITALFDLSKDLRVVLCGKKVARAFGFEPEFWRLKKLDSRQQAVIIPHPSGLNRVYNDKDARANTRAWLRWAALGENQP